jgi:hypothetical protein
VEVVTTSTTYRKLSYKELQNLAYDFLNEYTDGQLPVNLIYIINQIDNLYLMKYSAFARQHGLELEEVTNLLQSDDGALWYQEPTDTYILLYNDTVTSKERIRFTIAHELGHYVLRHNEITDKTIISRYNLTDSEYNEFEREANFFGKHLLVPFPVLGNYVQFFHAMDVQFIQRVFCVSYTVATYVIKNLKSMQKVGLVKVGHDVEERFEPYITKDKTTRICYTCHSSISRTFDYCPICQSPHEKGENDISLFLEKKEAEKEEMRYSRIELDSDYFPYVCPRCKNEEIDCSYKYCPICSAYLRNICIGHGPFYNDSFAPYPFFPQERETSGCGKLLDGAFRYCPDCGGLSSYFNQELLSYWEHELNNGNLF